MHVYLLKMVNGPFSKYQGVPCNPTQLPRYISPNHYQYVYKTMHRNSMGHAYTLLLSHLITLFYTIFRLLK